MTSNEDRIASLERELATAKSKEAEETERLSRMRTSLSWRLTLPLRALRRAFIDPFTRLNAANSSSASVQESNPETVKNELPSAETKPAEESPSNPNPGPPPAYRDYRDFCARMEPLVTEYSENFAKRLDRLKYKPLISIILPVYNPEIRWLREAIDSVIKQIYPNWELCIADDASPNHEVHRLLDEYQNSIENVKIVYRESNGHISEASNSALQLATGEFVALLDHDDLLAPHALARIVDCLNEYPDSVLIYSDEDKVDENGERSQPHFKSDWNPDLLIGQNFISHLGVYRRSCVAEIGGFRKGFEGAQDWDLALRITERCEPGHIRHIPEVLYHWRSITGSTAKDIGEKDYAHEAAGKALENRFSRIGISATLEPVDRFYWRPRYAIPRPNPEIAIIIPTRDQIEHLRNCIDGILTQSTYPRFKIVIANNDSQEPATFEYFEEVQKSGVEIFDAPGEFNFAKINNDAIRNRNETLICLLNNDTTIDSPEWLEELAMHACRKEIGPVGAKLLYPHGHVQHAGIVLGIGGVASEAFKRIHKTDDGYIHRVFLIGNYSAVTGACMMFRKSVWEEVGGLNENDIPNAFGDVDFCLRGKQLGYRTLFTPFALLTHHESESRGDDLRPEKIEAFKKAVSYMETTWTEAIRQDPYYNPNLTLQREDFTLAFPPRGYSTS